MFGFFSWATAGATVASDAKPTARTAVKVVSTPSELRFVVLPGLAPEGI
jgi:hypothetical protein